MSSNFQSSSNTNGSNNSKEVKVIKTSKRLRNPYLKKVEPAMLENQYIDEETKEISNFYNESYVYNKLCRDYINPLKLSKKEWNKLAKKAWQWKDEERTKEIQKIIDSFKDDPETKFELFEQLKKNTPGLKLNPNKD